MSDNDSDDHSGLALLLLMEEDEKERQAAEEPKCRECPYRNRRCKDTISDALDRKRCKDNAKLFGCAFLIALILAPILTIGAYVHEAVQKSRANARYAEYRRMQAEINARFAAEEKAREEKRDAAIRELTKEIFGEEFVRVGPGKIDFGESVAPDKRILKISQPFWLGRTEVTWRQWAKIMGGDDGGHPDLPVIVTGETARQFCQILNRRYLHRLDALRCRFELPVPHYWRYAAAGGDRHRGVNVYSGSDELDRVGWYAGNSGGVLHNVAQKQPNELGLFDMSGNAGELCDVGFPVYKTCTVRGGNAKSTAEQCRVMTESAVRSIFSTRAGFRVMLN